MKEYDKKYCSVYCVCINDTIKLTDCEEYSDFSTKERRCAYGQRKEKTEG